MESRHFKRIILLLNVVSSIICLEENQKEHEELCQKLGQNPYFEPEMVVGKSWRIYHSWQMDLGYRCIDVKFKPALPMIVNRIYNDMNEYLEQQPPWDAATLYLFMGKSKHEMLLFDDQGPAGRFQALPNVMRDGNLLSPNRSTVPLMSFQLKLLRGGIYLVILDCKTGVASLAARHDEPPPRAELNAVAAELDLGDDGGAPACPQDTNTNENVNQTSH